MTESTLHTKTHSVRCPSSIDAKLEALQELNYSAHGFMPSKGKVLNAAIAIGIDELIKTYQGDSTHA